MLIGLSDDPPEILTKSPYREGLLYFARNEPLEKVQGGISCTKFDPKPVENIGKAMNNHPCEVDVDSFQVIKDGYQKFLGCQPGCQHPV